MSRFDKYAGDRPLIGHDTSSGARVPTANRAAEAIAKAATQPSTSGGAKRLIYGETARIAILLDATGSMAALLQAAKASIAEIVTKSTREAGRPIEIELFVYRDYDVPAHLLERSGRSSEPQKLIKWLAGKHATGGGANDGEAIEAALQPILDDGAFDVVLLAGDEPSNSRSSLAAAGRRNTRNAHDLAQELGAKQIPIHSFVVGDDPRTQTDFATLSKLTGGQTGRLDGSAEMIDLAVMAILSKLKGSESVRSYMNRTRLSDNSRAFGQLLLGKSA